MVANCSSRRRAGADVARVDAVLVERARAVGKPGEQQVPVVVKVADERRGAAGIEHPLLDLGNRGRRFGQIDGDPDHLRSGRRQLDALLGRRPHVGGIGHRHRLDDDRRTAADLDLPDLHADRLVELQQRHGLCRSLITKARGPTRSGRGVVIHLILPPHRRHNQGRSSRWRLEVGGRRNPVAVRQPQ